MKKLFATIRQYALLQGIFYVLLGAAILIQPEGTMNLFISILSLYFVVTGGVSLVRGLTHRDEPEYSQMSLYGGGLFLIVGVLIYLFAKALASLLPIILGIFILISGISKLMLSREYRSTTKFPLIYGVILVVLGVLLLANPFETVLIVFQIFGAILLPMGVIDIVTYFKTR